MTDPADCDREDDHANDLADDDPPTCACYECSCSTPVPHAGWTCERCTKGCG